MIDALKDFSNSAFIRTNYAFDVKYSIPYGEDIKESIHRAFLAHRKNFSSSVILEPASIRINSSVFVAYERYLHAVIKLNERFDMDVAINVPSGDAQHESRGKVEVLNKRDFASKVEIDYTNKLFPSRAYVAHEQYTQSMARLNAQFEMDVFYSYVQPPMQYYDCLLQKDAFLRESKPRLNYGKLQTLMVGSDLTGNFRTLLQFDISSFYNIRNAQVRSMDLTLYSSTDIISPMTIEIHEVTGTWTEDGVTWSGAPNYSSTIIGTILVNSMVTVIDLKDYLASQMLKQKQTINIILKSSNENVDNLSFFYAREFSTVTLRPSLLITYFDPSWSAYIGSVQMNQYATIRRNVYNNFMSKYNLFRHNIKTNKMVITDPKSKFSKITITSPILNSRMKIYQVKDIDSMATLRAKSNSNFNFQAILNPALIGHAKLRYKTDLGSVATIRQEVMDDSMDNKGIINRKFVNSVALIQYSSNLGMIAHLRPFENNQINSVAGLLDKGKLSKVKIYRVKNISSTVRIRSTNMKTQINSLAGLKRNSIFSKSDIFHSKDFSSSLFIHGYSDTQVTSQVDIYQVAERNKLSLATIVRAGKEEQRGRINLYQIDEMSNFINLRGGYAKNLASRVSLRGKGNINYLSKFDVKQVKDLHNTIYLDGGKPSDFYSVLTILGKTTRDMPSSIWTRDRDEHDFNSGVNLHGYYFEDSIFNGSVFINGYESSNLLSGVTINLDGKPSVVDIRRSNNSNLYGHIKFPKHLDLSNTVLINNPNEIIDMASIALIRQHKNNDVDSSAFIISVKDLASTVTLRLNKYKDIASHIHIPERDNLNSLANVYHTSDLYSTYFSRRDGEADKLNSAFIRQISELEGIMQTYNHKSITERAKIRQKVNKDLQFFVTLRQFDASDIDTLMRVRGGYSMRQIACKFGVWNNEYDFMPFSVYIQSNARLWIPNVHAKEVFDYSDRKLPRQWIRKNFIQD